MALQDLHGAICPAKALLLEVDERVRHQPATVSGRHVCRFVSGLKDAQPELSILGDTPLGPSTRGFEEVPSDECHGAVLNDGVALIARDHADVEETAILGVTHRLEGALAFVAIVLWRLDDGDTGVLKSRYGLAQPVRLDHVVAVDQPHTLRIRGGLAQSEVQGSCFETGQRRDMEEAEALTQPGTVRLDR